MAGPVVISATQVAVATPFDNTTNGFAANNVQAAIEEGRSLLTIPSTDQNYYVTKQGSDSTGNGSFGKPYLTIGTALTTITDSSATKRYVINVGPGDYSENLVLKANVFVKGSGPITTRITGSTININDTTWNNTNDNRSGFQDIDINNVATWDFTAQASGSAGKLYFFNIRTGATWTTTANNSINQFIMQDCELFGTTAFVGMTTYISASSWESGNITVNSSALSNTSLTIVGGSTNGNITATWTANAAVNVALMGLTIVSSTVLTATGASCSVSVNDGSLPIPANRSFTSGATLTRLNDNYAAGLLTATGQVDSSTAVAPINGQVLTATSATTSDWQDSDAAGFIFGDGSDGNVSISTGTTTLTRTMYYDTLTLSGTAIVDANGFKIFCRTALILSSTASIIRTPNVGSTGSTNTAGAGASGMSSNDMGTGTAGVAGSNGGSNSGGIPGNAAGTTTGYGGAGGASGSAGSTGTLGAAGTYTNVPERVVRMDHIYLLNYKEGGQGGAGGAGGAASLLANGGGGGGGGSGGGVIMIFARTFNNTSSVGIVAKGGAGGNGGAAPSGNSNGGGGGGGGGGGQIYIICLILTAAGTLNVSGGAGGTGGAKAGTGAVGGSGSTGSTGHTTVYSLASNAWMVT